VPDAYRPRLANSYYDRGAEHQQQILRKVCLNAREAIKNQRNTREDPKCTNYCDKVSQNV
jgi:hypothetical protein